MFQFEPILFEQVISLWSPALNYSNFIFLDIENYIGLTLSRHSRPSKFNITSKTNKYYILN